jgi:hypothetical protein
MHTEKITTWSVLEDVKNNTTAIGELRADHRSVLSLVRSLFHAIASDVLNVKLHVGGLFRRFDRNGAELNLEPKFSTIDPPSRRLVSHISTSCFLGRVQENESLDMAWSSAPLHRCRL